MTSHVLNRGYRRLRLGESAPPAPSSFALEWAYRVIANGGALPSNATVNALSGFWDGLVFYGLNSKMKAINCFAPDSLAAALTPLYCQYGNTLWTNHNFLAGDLSVSGLSGNGTNKYLETGLNPNFVWSGDTSAGITVYVSVNPNVTNTDLDIGASTGGGAQSMYLGSVYASTSLWHFPNNVGGQGALTVSPNPQNTGYFSGNRTAANASALYVASSSLAHQSAGSIATTGGTRPNQAMFCFGNSNAGALQLPTHKTLSFVAVHDGLAITESLSLFGLVQSLRGRLGGGFI